MTAQKRKVLKVMLRLSSSVEGDITVWDREPKGCAGLEEIEKNLLEHIESVCPPISTWRMQEIPVWAPERSEPR